MAITWRPLAARAGPTRHQTRADAVTPWISSSGLPEGPPHVIADQGMPPASTVMRLPSPGDARALATAAGNESVIELTVAGRIGAPSGIDARVESRSQSRSEDVAEMANQFVVQLKNEPGSMAVLAERLAAKGVDLRAIGGGGLGDVGHVIMTTADDEKTKAVLDEGGYTYYEGESILAEVDDRPGGMARVARELADAGVNIYGHLFLGRWGDRAMFAFVVDDTERARPILERKG